MNSPTNPQAKRHIGQILIDQGILTEDQLRIALLEQMKSHLPVGRLLVQLGFVSEATLRDALSEKLGLQSVDLAHIIVDPAALNRVPLGLDPAGVEVAVKIGKWGAYIRRGEDTAPVPKDLAPDELTLARALELLGAPRGGGGQHGARPARSEDRRGPRAGPATGAGRWTPWW